MAKSDTLYKYSAFLEKGFLLRLRLWRTRRDKEMDRSRRFGLFSREQTALVGNRALLKR